MTRPLRRQNTTDAARAVALFERLSHLGARSDLSSTELLVAHAVALHTGDGGVARVTTVDLMQATRFAVGAVRRAVHALADKGVWATTSHGAHGFALEWSPLHEGAVVVKENATVAGAPTFALSSSPGQLWRRTVERAFVDARAFGAPATCGAPVQLSDAAADALGQLCESLAAHLGDRELVPGALRAGFIGWMRGVVARGAVPLINWAAKERDLAEVYAGATKPTPKRSAANDDDAPRGPRRIAPNTFASFAPAAAVAS